MVFLSHLLHCIESLKSFPFNYPSPFWKTQLSNIWSNPFSMALLFPLGYALSLLSLFWPFLLPQCIISFGTIRIPVVSVGLNFSSFFFLLCRFLNNSFSNFFLQVRFIAFTSHWTITFVNYVAIVSHLVVHFSVLHRSFEAVRIPAVDAALTFHLQSLLWKICRSL